MRRSHVLLAGAVAIAGGAALLGAGSGGGSTPSAQIPGAPLAPGGVAAAAPAPPNAAAAAAVASVAVDLDQITREGDAYVAKLADGKKAVLTLDPELQQLAEKLLNESRAPRGAIVAMAPDGRILALAGRRTSEPKGAIKGTPDWHLVFDAWAPAASIFKLVTASALVDAGVDPDDKVCFHGGVRSVLEHNLRDDKRDSRCESLAFGVAHSQNAILGKLAFQKLDSVRLLDTANAFGFTQTLALAPGVFGQLALPSAHDLAFARAAAGFSDTKLSVMGGALLAATFAAGGEQPLPRLVAAIDGQPVPQPTTRRAITPATAQAVARMMAQTCDGGSAARSFGKGRAIRVAGKTGTLTTEKPFYMEHSWFVGFAPVEQPKIVVSVLLGNPENWHLRGHEAARRMIDRALRDAMPREKDRAARPRRK